MYHIHTTWIQNPVELCMRLLKRNNAVQMIALRNITSILLICSSAGEHRHKMLSNMENALKSFDYWGWWQRTTLQVCPSIHRFSCASCTKVLGQCQPNSGSHHSEVATLVSGNYTLASVTLITGRVGGLNWVGGGTEQGWDQGQSLSPDPIRHVRLCGLTRGPLVCTGKITSTDV